MNWPVKYDGHEYQPIPKSWLEHPNSFHRQQRGGPRLFAVSAACLNSRTLRIRYLHPTNAGVLICQTTGREIQNGIAPEALDNGTGWPHSLHPGRSEPNDVRRECELRHFRELWGSRLDEIEATDEGGQLVADGGTGGE